MGLGIALHDLFGGGPQAQAPGMQPQPTGAANPTGVSLDPSVTNLMQQAPAPAHHGSMLLGILADALAGAAGHEGPYARMMGEQRQRDQEQAQWGLRRRAELEDYAAKQKIEQQYAKPPQPYRTQDNAGNVWEQGADGQFTRIFTDKTPKQYVQDGMLVTAPNPYATEGAPAAPPAVIDESVWNSGKPVGGPTHPTSGTFRRSR